MRTEEEIVKMLVEFTGVHSYSVGARMAKPEEIEFRKGQLNALRWVLGLDQALVLV